MGGDGVMKTGVKNIKQGKEGRMKTNVDGQEVLTIAEVAILLRMKPVAIYNAIKNGVIPALKVGNRWRFSKQAVLESLNVKK